MCGSCYAFSTTGAVEGSNFITTGELLSFSEQQLVDCEPLPSLGCLGGNPLWSFRYLRKHSAILEQDYPYTSGKTMWEGSCKEDTIDATEVKVITSGLLKARDVSQMKAAVAR